MLSFVDEEFLQKHALNKGVMTIIDEDTATGLYSDIRTTTEASGGSAANTVAGIASLGGKPAFLGRVKDDEFGKIFTHDLNGIGVDFNCAPAIDGKATARCMVFITPDAERTMATFLGACTEFDENYVDEEKIKNSKLIYVEGYLWDEEKAKNAIQKAMKIAKANNIKTSFTLSDPFCVSRHKQQFLDLLPEIDILFANEEEALMLFDASNFEEAATIAQGKCEIIVITKGAAGSAIITRDEIINVAATKIDKLVDTTGAGDLYAGGFLYGYTQEKPLAECGRIGTAAAANIITQLGARPLKPLKDCIAA